MQVTTMAVDDVATRWPGRRDPARARAQHPSGKRWFWDDRTVRPVTFAGSTIAHLAPVDDPANPSGEVVTTLCWLTAIVTGQRQPPSALCGLCELTKGETLRLAR